MTKLSKAQQKVLDKAKKDIDEARSKSFYDWFKEHSWSGFSDYSDEEIEEHLNKKDKNNFWKSLYNDNKNGIAHTHCNGKTIYKLESLGLIEIIRDGTNKVYGYDFVKVLGY